MMVRPPIFFSWLLVLAFLGCVRDCTAQLYATVHLDTAETFQEIDGFGTAMINYKDFPPEYSDTNFVRQVVQDLGLSILRIPIIEHLEYANDDDDPDHFNWPAFYLSDNNRRQGLDHTMKLAQSFRDAGVERFMMAPWSPPQFMKTNRAPIQGGFLRQDMTAEFAEYLAAAVLLAKHNYGIDIGWVSMQNESLFVQFYRSCVYHPEMMREAVRAVMRKFAAEGLQTELLLNEDMLFADRVMNGIRPTLTDPETATFRGNIAVHRKQGKEGLLQLCDSLRPYQRKVWMTETSGHDANWQGAFQLANDIHEHLVYGNVSAWLYWQISGNTGSSDPGRYTLMLEGKPTKKYHASKHYYRYIRPGARRFGATTTLPEDSLRVAAFRHLSSGELTVVLINNTDSELNLQLSEANGALPTELDVYLTTHRVDCIPRPRQLSSNSLSMPARSIVTLHKKGGAAGANSPQGGRNTIADDTSPLHSNGLLGNPAPFPAKVEWQRAADGDASLLQEAQAYLQAGNIDSARFNGWTLLHDAALNGDCETIAFSLANGADLNARADDGWTPLHAAAAGFVGKRLPTDGECNKYDVFTRILAAGPDVSQRTTDGLTAMHVAVMNAYTGYRQEETETLRKITDLVAAGADVNAVDTAGRTPLHWACMQGYAHFTDNSLMIEEDVVAALLSAGGDPQRRDAAGRQPLDYAVAMGYGRIVDLLTGSVEEPSIESRVRVQQQYGAELLQAAWRGEQEEVRRLLSLGADTDYLDSDGFSALERARDNGFTEIVKLLEEYRADDKE